MYYIARRPGEAIKPLQEAIELDPRSPFAPRLLGLCYLALTRCDDAIAELRRAVSLSERNAWLVSDLGYALAVCGRRKEAQNLLAELEGRATHEYIPPIYIGTVYIALGEWDAALDHLEQATLEGSTWCVFGMMEPPWNTVRSDPRFTSLARTVGLAI